MRLNVKQNQDYQEKELWGHKIYKAFPQYRKKDTKLEDKLHRMYRTNIHNETNERTARPLWSRKPRDRYGYL